MVILSFLFAIISLLILIKSSNYAIKYSSRLSKGMHLPEFVVSFFIIAFISVLPEATISIISAFDGEPGLGLGTLLGSNVADLTLVVGIVSLFSFSGIKVKSKLLKNNFLYLILLFFPILLGFDGRYSRADGLILILAGVLFFVKIYNESRRFHKQFKNNSNTPFLASFIPLVISLTILLLSAAYTVKFAVAFAHGIHMPAILVGLSVLALGTCLPELIFSIKAVKKNHDDLALGDILGTVITDTTMVLGLVAIISPFNYDVSNIFVTGSAMFLAGFFLLMFMKSDKSLSKKEGVFLILLYILFLAVEFLINHF